MTQNNLKTAVPLMEEIPNNHLSDAPKPPTNRGIKLPTSTGQLDFQTINSMLLQKKYTSQASGQM